MDPDYCDRCDCLRPTVREFIDHATGVRARICEACYLEWDRQTEGMHDVEAQEGG